MTRIIVCHKLLPEGVSFFLKGHKGLALFKGMGVNLGRFSRSVVIIHS